jgi:ribulose-bisphosphate carboxylase large chain
MNYINLRYQPSSTQLIAMYSIEPQEGKPFEEVVSQIASEATIGTWGTFWKTNEQIGNPLRPTIFWFDATKHYFKIALPEALFEKDNIPQILSILAGNVSGMTNVKKIRLIDISLPKTLTPNLSGPKFGLQEFRQLTQIPQRPICGVMMKPKVGLDSTSFAELAYGIWKSGCDLIHDAETLTNQETNPFEQRVEKTVAQKKKSEKESREVKLYFPNITAGNYKTIKGRAEFVAQTGNEGVMINPLLIGWSATESIIKYCQKLSLVVLATRVGHATITHNPYRGISPIILQKIIRCMGADASHIMNPISSSLYAKQKSQLMYHTYTDHPLHKASPQDELLTLPQDWQKTKKVLPIISGGIHPAAIESISSLLDKDFLAVASEGVFYHPNGMEAGAKALRQACDAIGENIPLKDYANSHPELKIALEKWS